MKKANKIIAFIFIGLLISGFLITDLEFLSIKISFRTGNKPKIFVFSQKEFNNLKWVRQNKELVLNGIWLDVEKITFFNNKIFIFAFLDKKEINFKKNFLTKKAKNIKKLSIYFL